MILGFVQKHKGGEPTHFRAFILCGRKKHTIRKGKRFKPGMILQLANGVRTKSYKCFQVSVCTSVQDIEIYQEEHKGPLSIKVDGHNLKNNEIMNLVVNDGFVNMYQFEDYFLPFLPFEGQLIHWTDLKYHPYAAAK